jgi:uncharacterized protein
MRNDPVIHIMESLSLRISMGVAKVIFIGFILFYAGVFSVWAQANKINPDGYNVFYYENGKISSEGNMRQGKPDGYWKTYFTNGRIKSEGNRLNFELDSLWIFYNDQGDTLQKIDYKNGHKNGYTCNFEYKNIGGKIAGGLVSKELFLNDNKQGISYYYENGFLLKTIPYKDNRKQGLSKEYDKSGKVVGITEYNNDYIIYHEKINQVEKNGLKQGTWKEFHPNNRIFQELNYMNDSLSGYYKEFDVSGSLIKLLKYSHGQLVNDSLSGDYNPVKWKEDYYDNGQLKFRGSYKENIPVGVHKEYSKDGLAVSAREFNDDGQLTAEGMMDVNDRKQGTWKFYFETGELKSKGDYKDNLKTGEWIYYYISGQIEQRGKFVKDKPAGTWTRFYENGNKWCEENLKKGVEDGSLTEYNKEGIVILQGDYVEGEREGVWKLHNGDDSEEGSYQAGLQHGPWKGRYANGKLRYEMTFVQGVPDGKFKIFYDNGLPREEGFYTMGSREKTWNKYDMEGNLYLTITYKNDKEIKLNGVKIKLPKGSLDK